MKAESALQGLKVVDFTIVGAGPLVNKYLADHGAQVVWIETFTHPDVTRTTFPYKDGKVGINRSAGHLQTASSKYSMGLNMKTPHSREVAYRLVKWADVLVQGYKPGLLEKWGLGYEQIKAINPKIIMLSTSMQGQTGHRKNLVGFGFNLKGMAGFVHLAGWPDRDAVGVPVAYTDHIAPWFAVSAIIAALDYRRRTGKGQHIDVSQYEAGLQFLASPLLDYTVNGRIEGRRGNRSVCSSPHGVFRCEGEDSWVAIAVRNDEEWQAFCGVISSAWTKDPRFNCLEKRKENEELLEKLIDAWTVNRTAAEVMSVMQSAGVPAGVVNTSQDLYEDAQLKHRGYFAPLQHPEMGAVYQPTWPAKLSRTPARLRVAPCLAEHTLFVAKEFLGMSDDEIAELVSDGTLELPGAE